MSKFKIEFQRPGIQYAIEYRDSIRGAVKVAQSKGWDGPDDKSRMKPISATIHIKTALEYYQQPCWELVANVDIFGVSPVPSCSRPTIQGISRKIEQLSAEIADAKALYDLLVPQPKEVTAT